MRISSAPTKDEWLFEITPKNSLLSLNLKEVWPYKDLLILFVKRDINISKIKFSSLRKRLKILKCVVKINIIRMKNNGLKNVSND